MGEKKFGRVVVIAPTRSTCLNISMVLSNGAIPQTLLMQEKGKEIFEAVDCLELGGFGVVAGTGTGKTVAIRDIARRVIGESLSVDVVTREHEATERTWQCNTLVVTPGVALNWFKSRVLSSDDLLVFDEIHQTSEHLELTLALAKRVGCTFVWMSATIDPTLYSEYMNAATVIECSAFDPSKRAEVECRRDDPEDFFSDERLEDFIAGERAVAVFVPTRAMAERLSRQYGQKEGLYCDFYHGGEKAEKLRQFLKGDVPKPFMVFMTIAGASSLNILGLDTVVIVDEMYKGVVHSGVSVLEKVRLGNNEILQMGGRVSGRMENSRVYILGSREIDFHNLKPTVPEFVLGGDLQRVALTCAKLGVNASELDLISKIDTSVYNAEVQRFRNRGIIEVESENLTPYGKKVERLPVEPGWAELVVNAEQVGGEMLNVVAICSCIESLYSILRKSSRLEGLGVSGSDHLTAYNIVVSALRQFGFVQKSKSGVGSEYSFRGDWVKKRLDKQTGQSEKSMGEFAQWCDFMGFNGKAIKEVVIAMKSVFRQLGQKLPEPMELQMLSGNDHLHLGFVALLARVQSLDFVHDQQNSKAMSAYGTVWAAQSSMTQARRVLGKIRYWTDKRGTRRATVEGTEIPEDLVAQYGKKTSQSVTRVTNEGVEIQFRLVFAEEDLGTTNIVVSDDEVPESLLGKAEMKFVEAFASKQISGVEVVVDKNVEVRRESERLGIRSGGSFCRITEQDERLMYESELLGKGIISAQSFEQALREKRVNVQNLFLASISDSERERIESENPEIVKVGGQDFAVQYGKDWSSNFYARVEVEKEFAYSTKTESVKLPSGREVQIICGSYSATSFSELVGKLLASDCYKELRVPQEEPWQKSGWVWSLTDLGQQLKSGLESIVREHAENPKASDMAGRIEVLKQAVVACREELAKFYYFAERIISDTESKLAALVGGIEDEVLKDSFNSQVKSGVEKSREQLGACDYKAVGETCRKLLRNIKSGVSSAKNAYTGFRQIWCRRGGSNNGDGWVVCPDGSFRENDSIENPRSRYQGEGYKDWSVVFPDELAISWRKRTQASEHEFETHHLPVNGLTEAQVRTLERLLEELESEWDGRSGLASGSGSPSVGGGWVNNSETDKSLTPNFETSRQKREAELRKKSEVDSEWATKEGVPGWMIEESSVQKGGFERLRAFVSNVDDLNPYDLNKHICLNCGRSKIYDHFSEISEVDDFFQGFDPNDVVRWIWDRLEGRKGSATRKPKKTSKLVASAGSANGFNNPFAGLGKMIRK